MMASNKEVVESNRKMMESVTKREKDREVLLEEIEQRRLFSVTSDNNVAAANVVEDSQSVAGDSVLTATTSATSTAQRQLQNQLKQKERELDVKQKQMEAEQEEKERKLLLREKALSDKFKKDLSKQIGDAKKQFEGKERKLQSENDKIKRGKSKSLEVLIVFIASLKHSQYFSLQSWHSRRKGTMIK